MLKLLSPPPRILPVLEKAKSAYLLWFEYYQIFLMMLWETKSLNDKKYLSLSKRLDEIGRNLGGWRGKLLKENSLKS